jgi:type II secretory pathway component GspD/PulD (secretin)
MFSQDNGLRLTYSNLGDAGFDMLFKFQQSDDDVNILSAPRILTLDNQEAAILVGRKYPIIRSETGGGNASSQSTITLDYYENIGIQLNVLPQVSDGEFINMVVHPVVSEIEGFTDGSVELLESDITASTKYPIMTVREAETQILLKSQEIAVIGGLQTQRDSVEIQKVPLIGDIPYLGRLFRREIKGDTTIDLMIFIKATIIDRAAYARESAAAQQSQEIAMGIIDEMSEDDESAEAEETVEEVVVEEEVDVVDVVEAPVEEEPEASAEVENEEILALVRDINAETNTVEAVE